MVLCNAMALSAESYVPREGQIPVSVYQTTKDRPFHEIKTTPFTKHSYQALVPFDLDAAVPATEYLGCGISMTDASCWILSEMNQEERRALYDMAFSKKGANLSMLRLNCGSSDYATEVYNYNDHEGDVAMKHFSIERDELYMIPIIREVLSYRPDAYVYSAVWSVPGWMKDNGRMVGGRLLDKYVPAVANYWAEYLKAYRDRGIDIKAISAQNEPETDQLGGAPATLVSPEQENALIKEYFPKVFKKYGLDTEVWLLDHNYSRYERVLAQLEDARLREKIGAIAWHPYGGSPDDAAAIHEKYPDIPMHLTERGPSATMWTAQTCHWWCDVIFNALNAGCSSYTGWNLVLDENGAPNTGKSPCMGLFTKDSQTGELSTSTQYEVFCQFSPFVERGAQILKVSGPQAKWLRSIAFRNPNGDYVIVFSYDGQNGVADRERIEIKFKDQYLHLPLPKDTWSMTTVVIRNSAQPESGNSVRPEPEDPNVTVITLLEGEKWWGGAINDGDRQPYSDIKPLDLSRENLGGATAPFLLSSRGRYVWSDRPFSYSFEGPVLKIESRYGKVEPVLAGSTLKDACLAAMKAHFPFNGVTPPELFFTKPQFNNWIEIYINGINQKVVDEYTDAIAANDFPCGVYMMDGGYLTHQGSNTFVPEDFPDPEAMFSKIRSYGWKSLIWAAYFVSADSREYKSLRYHPNTGARDYLVHRSRGKEAAILRWWSGISAAWDLTNPEVSDYYVGWMKEFLGRYGIDGIKFDAGDPASFFSDNDFRFYQKDAEPVDYVNCWNRVGLEFPWNEFRSGFRVGGMPLVMRLHDKKHTWEDLRKISPQMQLSGLMGSPYAVADMVGGGDCVSFPPSGFTIDHKLFIRSCQLQALMPMMQFSLAPWRVLTKEECDICRHFAELHVAFGPYIMELARHASKTGEPILRSMEYEFPGMGYDRQMQQFMLGSRYLVAPVTDEDDHVTVYLPKGKWKDDLGKVFKGPQVIQLQNVPLDRLPYYERMDLK